jgi:hypothetical protein
MGPNDLDVGIQDHYDMAIYYKVAMGTPGQELDMILDTGSSWLYALSSTCTTCFNSYPNF